MLIQPFFLIGHAQGGKQDVGTSFPYFGDGLLFPVPEIAVVAAHDIQSGVFLFQLIRGGLRHAGLGSQQIYTPALFSPALTDLFQQLDAGHPLGERLAQTRRRPQDAVAVRRDQGRAVDDGFQLRVVFGQPHAFRVDGDHLAQGVSCL